MKKVLIGLDYNSSAEKVAEAGYEFAKAMNAEVTLIHVVADVQYYTSAQFSPIMGYSGFDNLDLLEPTMVEDLKKSSQDFLATVRKHLDDESIEILVVEGDTTEAILDAAKNIKATLIVMGSHSRKWLEDIVVGSATSKVLHQTTIPLLIIPTGRRK